MSCETSHLPPSSRKARSALIVLLLVLFLPVTSGDGVAEAIPQERVLSTGVADSTNALGPKWRKVNFVAQQSGPATVRLAWTGNANMRFQLLRANGTVIGGDISTSRVSPKSYSATLVAGTSYSVTVWSYSGVGYYTLSLTEDVPDNQNPTVPSGLEVATRTENSIGLTWTPSTDNSGAVRYEIYENDVAVTTTDQTSIVRTGLTGSTTYSYFVRAYDATGNQSDASNTVTTSTLSAVPDDVDPSAPENLTSTSQTSTSISLQWSASTDNVGISRYIVYRDGSPAAEPTGTTYIDTDRLPETSYRYTVAAVDTSENVSDLSEEIEVSTPSAPAARPNIIVIETDDQRGDLITDMPRVRQWLGDGGTTFPNAYVSTPSCCPSRATLMSGRYAHNNGQYNQNNVGADLNLTIQRYLHDAGYFTGHAGKFLHWLPLGTVAPHWDRWTYFKGGYTNVTMNFDGRTLQTQGYSTSITFDRGIDYLRDFEARDDSKPFYIQLTPVAPHSPLTPESKYATAPVSNPVRVPSHSETDRRDKPPFVSYTNETYESGVARRAAMIRMLYTVDEQVDRLMLELQALGELDNTLVIYTSDNGYFYGEHGRRSKFLPYREAVSVPFLIRWPGQVAAGAVDQRLVTHVDIAPTVLAAAGVTQSYVPFDGRDILSGHSRPYGITEYYYDLANGNYISTWAALHTPEYLYVEYYGTTTSRTTVTFREYYDNVSDPYQMENLLRDGTTANDPDVTALSTLLAEQKNCVGTVCR